MTTKNAELVLRLVDQVSAPAKAVKAALAGVFSATKMLGDTARSTRRAATDMAGLSVPLLMLGNDAARQVYEFEKVGNALEAVTGMTADQRGQLEQLAQDLNAKFPATNSEILGAALELAKAGQDYEQIRGSLENTLNLALAGDFGIQDSSAILINVATAMRMAMDTELDAAKSTAEVADMIAYAANKSTADVEDIGVTMRYVASAAAATGMSLDELGATTAVLAKNGIMGSNAGTGLRYALLQLINPSKTASDALGRLSIDLGDYVSGAKQISAADLITNLGFDGIDISGLNIAGQIQAALDDPAIAKSPAKLTSQISSIITDAMGGADMIDSATLAQSLSDSLAVLGTQVDFTGLMKALRDNPQSESLFGAIFGKQHAVKMMALLAGDLDGTLRDFQANASGAADTMSSLRILGVVADWTAATAAVENLQITIGKSGILADAAVVLQGFADAIDAVSHTSPELIRLGAHAAIAVAGLAPLGWVLSGISATIAFLSSPIVLIAGALAALAFLNWDNIVSFFSSFQESFKTWLNPQALTPITDAIDNLKAAFTGLTGGIDFTGAGSGFGKFVAQTINKIPDFIASIQRLRDQAQPILDVVTPVIASFASAVGSVAKMAGRLVVGGAKGIVAFFTGLTTGISPETMKSLGNLGRLLADMAIGINNWFASIADNSGTTSVSIFVEAMRSLGGMTADGLNKIVADIQALMDLFEALKTMDLEAAGKAIVDSLTKGILSGIPGLKEAVAAIQGLVYLATGGAHGGTTPGGSVTTGPGAASATINGRTDPSLPTPYAAGGSYDPGLILAGEKGPELQVASGHGQIFNANETRDMLSGKGGGGGGGDVHHTWHITGSNADEIARKISSILDSKLQRSRQTSMDGRMLYE